MARLATTASNVNFSPDPLDAQVCCRACDHTWVAQFERVGEPTGIICPQCQHEDIVVLNGNNGKVLFFSPLGMGSVPVKTAKNRPPSSPSSARKRSSASERLLTKAITGEYRYAMLGLVLGMAAIIGGVILGLNGVAGSTSWTAKILGLESNVNDAAPGVVLFLVGLFLVRSTKPNVKLDNLRG